MSTSNEPIGHRMNATLALERDRTDSERVSDKVAEHILAMIATGALTPGQRLPGERQLAENMGVSRVSVRAALQRLKTQGFLSAVQGGGTRVISSAATMDPGLAQLVRLNLENLHDLAEIRANLEGWAARRAAACATAAHIAEMAAIVTAMEKDCHRGRHKAEDDVRFHLAIAKATGSAIYMHIVGVIRDILRQMLDHHRYELFPTAEEDLALLHQHKTIFAAIQDRDPDRAAAAMHDHLGWVAGHYEAERRRRSRSQG